MTLASGAVLENEVYVRTSPRVCQIPSSSGDFNCLTAYILALEWFARACLILSCEVVVVVVGQRVCVLVVCTLLCFCWFVKILY